MSKRRRNGSKKLALVDFERTGRQDCGNSFEQGDYDLFADPADAWKAAEPAFREGEDEWIAQQSGDFDDLDPHEAFEAWLAGYRWCAIAHLDALRLNRTHDTTLYWLYIGDERDGDPIDSFDTFEDAIDMLARANEGAIWVGSGLGPDSRVVHVEAGSEMYTLDAMRWERGQRDESMDKRFKQQRAELRRRGHRFVDKDTRS